MARTGGKLVDSAFTHFCNEFGFRKAESYNDEGGLQLDHQGVYGGYVIEEVSNARGAVSHPFGDVRMKASAMYEALWFAIRVHKHAGK